MKMRGLSCFTAWMFSLALVLGVAAMCPVHAFAVTEQAKPVTSTEATAPNGAVPAKEEQKKIVEAAEAEIVAATAAARREIQNYAAELAIDQAAKKLVVSAETDRLLVENFARRLGAEVGGEN